MFAAFTLASATVARAADTTSWAWAGWGGGGFFWSAAFDPTNSNVIYLGGDVAGIYKTEDQGRNWRFINGGLHEYGVFSLAVSPSQPQTVYAMTMDGIAKSTNGGGDWEPLAATRNKTGLGLSVHRPGSVRAIAVDPRNSETIYAGSGAGLLCKSSDGGATWANLDYRSALAPLVPAKPPAPAAAGTGCLWLAYASVAGDWASHGRAEKFISQKGDDWSAYGRLTAKVFVPAGAPKLEVQLVVQSGPAWLWQAGPNVAGQPGEWTDVALDLTQLKEMQTVHIAYLVIRAGGQAFKGEIGLDAMVLHPIDATRLSTVLGDWEKPGSLDGWKAGNHAKDAPQVAVIRNSADAPVRVKEPIGGVVVAPSDPNLLFVAHRTLGVFRSADAGTTWQQPETPRTASAVTVFPGDTKRVYGAFGKAGVWKSVDGGLTWAFASTGITNSCSLREVAVDPRNPDVLHAIGDMDWGGYYYRSVDGGATWRCIRRYTRDLAANPTLSDETGSGEFAKTLGGMSKLSNLALSPSNPDVVFLSARQLE